MEDLLVSTKFEMGCERGFRMFLEIYGSIHLFGMQGLSGCLYQSGICCAEPLITAD